MQYKKLNIDIKPWIKVLLIIAAALLVTLFTELFFNFKLWTLPSAQKGIMEQSWTMVEAELENKVYDGYQIEVNGYADKLIMNYTNESPSYFKVIVNYINRFGYEEAEVMKDMNSYYMESSTVKIGKNVTSIIIIPVKNATPDLVNEVVMSSIFIKNKAELNPFRCLFVLLFVLCVGTLWTFRKMVSGKIEYGFLIVGICAGLIFTLAMPLGRMGWDEEAHLRSVYFLDVTGSLEYNHFIDTYINVSMENNPYEHSAALEEYVQVMEIVNEGADLSTSPDLITNPTTTSGFATFSYLIMAVTANLCKLCGVPFGVMYVLIRLTNMFTYIIIVFFAIRKLPKGKLLMSTIALMPTPMFLAATISYDTIVTGFTYLGLAYLFYFILEEKKIKWWEYLVFIFAMGYGASPKAVYIPLILLGLFIPRERFKDKKTEIIMKSGIVLVFLALMSTFVLPALIHPSEVGDERGGNTSHAGQISTIFGNIPGYAMLLMSSIWSTLFEYSVGTSALDTMSHIGAGTLTNLIIILLVFVTLTSENMGTSGLKPYFKYTTWVVIFGIVCLIWTAMYLSFTEVGKTTILGVQGRYYIPLLFPFLFTLCLNKIHVSWNKVPYHTACMMVSAFIIFYSIWENIITRCSF